DGRGAARRGGRARRTSGRGRRGRSGAGASRRGAATPPATRPRRTGSSRRAVDGWRAPWRARHRTKAARPPAPGGGGLLEPRKTPRGSCGPMASEPTGASPQALLAHAEWVRRLAAGLVRDDDADDRAQQAFAPALVARGPPPDPAAGVPAVVRQRA